MVPSLRQIAAILAFIAVVVATPLRADPDYPAFTDLVVDAAHALTPADAAEITRKLEGLQSQTGVQFAVATVPSLGGDEIEPYANALFRKWKIGQKGADNGLLLIWAPKERKIRFEVGRGLEGTMTDAQSKLILHNDMVPKLKAGDGAGALKAGVDDAIQVLTKDKADLPPNLQPARQSAGDPGVPLFVYAFIAIFILIFILGLLQSRRRGWSSGAPGGVVVGSWSSDFSDTNSSSGGGDSGFSGGGGGDSGGGGASDSY